MMNTLRRSLNIASLFAVATAGLIGFAAIAQDCAGKKAQYGDSTPQTVTDRNPTSSAARTELDRNGNSINSSFSATTSTQGHKSWKLAAIALAALGGGSTVFLAYRSWAAKQTVAASISQPPELEHPELQLTTVPSEALTEAQPSWEAPEAPVLLKR
jgi:hypothetical protein